MQEYILKAKGIKKYFGGVKALDGVDLEIKKGEIHCLAGENGCGKSTIINIISGYYTKDAGTLEIDGVAYEKMTPTLAIQKGVQVIYQDLSLFPNLTVLENLSITNEIASGAHLVHGKRMRETASYALKKIGLALDLNALVETLPFGIRQMIAISRALLNEAQLIIMDEPTTGLSKTEVATLFRLIRELQKKGIAILFVSHKLDEVFEIATRFTIFRNGKLVRSGDTKDLTQEKFTTYMTGRELVTESFEYGGVAAPTIFEVEHLSLENGFYDVSFSLKKGEIVGITGLLGSGRTELAEALFGRHQAEGTIRLDGKEVVFTSMKDAIEAGIGYVPADRVTEGLFMLQPIKDNISALAWEKMKGAIGTLSESKIDAMADDWKGQLSIALGDVNNAVGTLSGGNQQKVVLAKWLAQDLKLLILNGPTVGVDIGAKFDIYKLLKELAEKGLTILLISDDVPELLSNTNRILVMRKGRMVSGLVTKDIDEAMLAREAGMEVTA